MVMKKVAELTVDEFREIVREVVCEVLAEQQDDDGELRPEFVAELSSRMSPSNRGVPLEDVLRELDIEL